MTENPQMMEGMFPIPSFLTIVINQRNIPELHVRGEFGNPLDSSTELASLSTMATEFKEIHVYINSVGGNVELLVELCSILSKFEKVVTIGGGCIASAGFTLWCIGNVRTIQPHTLIMYHRESYGYSGKTRNHKDFSLYLDKLYSGLVLDYCGDILTPEEIKDGETSDVFLMAEELIERGACVSWDSFKEAQNRCNRMSEAVYTEIDGVMFFDHGDGTASPVQFLALGERDTFDNFLYDIQTYPDEWYDENFTGNITLESIEEDGEEE